MQATALRFTTEQFNAYYNLRLNCESLVQATYKNLYHLLDFSKRDETDEQILFRKKNNIKKNTITPLKGLKQTKKALKKLERCECIDETTKNEVIGPALRLVKDSKALLSPSSVCEKEKQETKETDSNTATESKGSWKFTFNALSVVCVAAAFAALHFKQIENPYILHTAAAIEGVVLVSSILYSMFEERREVRERLNEVAENEKTMCSRAEELRSQAKTLYRDVNDPEKFGPSLKERDIT